MLAAIASLLFVVACDTSPFTTGPAAVCREPGTQCQLPEGPLGVCERSPCEAGADAPCFQCVSQH
jgi:hypothetical protein